MNSIQLSEGARNHVVVLVHGIRDHALWQSTLRAALESDGFKVEATNYGRFNLLQFLTPSRVFRDEAIATIGKQIRIIKQNNSEAELSVIAHSFGTYVVARLMQQQFDVQFSRVIFCGSVVEYAFPFEQIQGRFSAPIINEVGTRDIWPALAESITIGYGSAGTYGFRRPLVRDRWHNGAGHGYFLDAIFCKRFWLPFLRDGTIVPGDDPEPPPAWLRFLSVVKLKYLLALVAALAMLQAVQLARKGDELAEHAGSQRESAAEQTVGNPVGMPAGLVEDLSAQEPIRRILAIRGLQDTDFNNKVADALLTLVRFDRSDDVRRAALEVLARFPNRHVAEQLTHFAAGSRGRSEVEREIKVAAANMWWAVDVPQGACFLMSEGQEFINYRKAPGRTPALPRLGVFIPELIASDGAKHPFAGMSARALATAISGKVRGAWQAPPYMLCNSEPSAQLPAQQSTPSRTFAVIIGISKYADESLQELALEENRPAAEEIARRLSEFPGVVLADAYDEQATDSWVRHQIAEVMARAKPSDTVLLYFSGAAGVDGNGQIFPQLAGDPKYGEALRLRMLKSTLAEIQAREKLVVLDTMGTWSFMISSPAIDDPSLPMF